MRGRNPYIFGSAAGFIALRCTNKRNQNTKNKRLKKAYVNIPRIKEKPDRIHKTVRMEPDCDISDHHTAHNTQKFRKNHNHRHSNRCSKDSRSKIIADRVNMERFYCVNLLCNLHICDLRTNRGSGARAYRKSCKSGRNFPHKSYCNEPADITLGSAHQKLL